MADEAVIVDKIGTIFLGGPPLVKVGHYMGMQIGEIFANIQGLVIMEG